MSETYGRRRGRLAAAKIALRKVDPLDGYYFVNIDQKIEHDLYERVAAFLERQAPAKKKRGPRRKKEVT